ncbi:MAG: alpha-L-fucosidase [Treponema sp.]|jgi:alpha-L-fucosidase|nr:alpha-L-fucosidase [Treponema sp.]
MTEREKRIAWFLDARLGMFIHWGLYAIPGQGEWYRSQRRVPVEDYEPYFREFRAEGYDPRSWARLAKEAGMRYAVFTVKHHDGFCLFDSALTNYKSVNTPAGRDLAREFADAFRAEGLKVGFYYSLLDWHHPDYPKYADMFHPMRGNEKFKDEKINFDRYLDYMEGQVEELVLNYGPLDILWFDFSYGGMSGKTWRAEELARVVRRYNPDILINNRLETSGTDLGRLAQSGVPPETAGDFASPEQCLPDSEPLNGDGKSVPWELCTTLNNSWAYTPSDRLYKKPSFIIHKLVECVSKGGNLLLNAGPDARGIIPAESRELLNALGGWMKRNGESVYGCGAAGFGRPGWGYYTRRGNTVYAHLFEEPIGPIPLSGIDPAAIRSVRLLSDGSEAAGAEAALGARKRRDIRFVTLGTDPNHTYPLPDPWDTVLKIELAG